jgi:hypothetical protein
MRLLRIRLMSLKTDLIQGRALARVVAVSQSKVDTDPVARIEVHVVVRIARDEPLAAIKERAKNTALAFLYHF